MELVIWGDGIQLALVQSAGRRAAPHIHRHSGTWRQCLRPGRRIIRGPLTTASWGRKTHPSAGLSPLLGPGVNALLRRSEMHPHAVDARYGRSSLARPGSL